MQQEKQLVKDYESGRKVDAICYHYGISRRTLYETLRKNGVKMRNMNLHTGRFCPLFISSMYSSIRCECFGRKTLYITTRYSSKAAMSDHKQRFCNGSEHKDCPYYKIIGEQNATQSN